MLTALLRALRFSGAGTDPLRQLDEGEWKRLLALCDRHQLTLTLGRAAAQALPDPVRKGIRERSENAALRNRQARLRFAEISGALSARGIEFAVLKGFTQHPRFAPDPDARVQYDIDLYCPPESVMPARDVLLELGYEPLERFGEFPTDHLPAMARKANWQWRGDYYDPEIPLSVDLHFRFWDEGTERIGAPGIGMFWERRVSFDGGGMACALHHCDALAYHALHLLRHLLRGDIRLSHAWELGYFLHLHASDCGFWRMWRDLHPPELRRLQAVCFRLAEEWFGCDMAAAAREEIRQLPGPVQTWFERYSCAPIDALTRPNKHELWLHMALLETWRDRRTVLRRRLLPARLPGPVDSPLVAESQLSRTARLHRRLRYAVHVASRACHHLRLLPPAIRDGAMWLLRDSRG